MASPIVEATGGVGGYVEDALLCIAAGRGRWRGRANLPAPCISGGGGGGGSSGDGGDRHPRT